MSIIRSGSGPGTDAGAVRQQEGGRGSRTPGRADAESVQAFRQAMEQYQAGRAAGQHARAGDAQPQPGAASDGEAAFRHGMQQDAVDPGRNGADVLPPPESAAMWQAQHLAAQTQSMPASAPPPPANPATLARMLERHVRQFAVSEGGTLNGDGQVLLRLDESTLPGTDLMLSRTADGWVLQADVRSAESFDAIRQAAGQLGERFAERGLGSLVVEPRYHG